VLGPPSEELARQVWPQIDGWLRQFDEGTNEPDLAGQGFLKLLKHLRGILLQHSVLLRRRFLCHAIWGDPLFATPEYAEFAERLVTGLIDGEEPHLIQVERANLLVAGELQTLGRTVASAETSIRLKITREQRSVVAALEEQKQIVENLSRRLNRRLYINDWFYERIQKAESRLRARRASPPRHHRFRPRPTATHGPGGTAV
jgi:Centromere DNA-binding protein complex CBF3 subunit, domain 2